MICLYYLRVSGVDLEQEDDPTGLLGFTLEHNKKIGLIEMHQDGLIERIVKTLGLHDGMVTKHHTPLGKSCWLRTNMSLLLMYSSVIAVLWECCFI